MDEEWECDIVTFAMKTKDKMGKIVENIRDGESEFPRRIVLDTLIEASTVFPSKYFI